MKRTIVIELSDEDEAILAGHVEELKKNDPGDTIEALLARMARKQAVESARVAARIAVERFQPQLVAALLSIPDATKQVQVMRDVLATVEAHGPSKGERSPKEIDR